MRLRRAVAVSLSIHLLAVAAAAISEGIRRCTRDDAPPAAYVELVSPPEPAPPSREAPPVPERLAEETKVAGVPVLPPAPEPEPAPPVPDAPATGPEDAEPSRTADALPPSPAPESPAATASADGSLPPTDNAAVAMDPVAAMHHQAVVSTADFYRNVPDELTRLVQDTLGGGALMSQGDALIHMDVTPSGQVGRAHVQANSSALLNRLERIDWTTSLPRRPLAACNAIHLRISVVGTAIRVQVELL